VRIFEIAEVMAYARELLESDPVLGDLWVQGEVTKVYQSGAGHLYFTLRGASSQLECVMFRSALRHARTRLEAGQAVVAHGGVSLYEARGQFQLYADLVEPEGLGQAFLQFELLRRRLEDEGLFALERKRALPPFPRRIGVATSIGGAVIHDIQRVLARRYPLVEVVIAPCAVQGEAAPREIVAALQRLNDYAASRLDEAQQLAAIDVIILARGGGAPEELAVFNDEGVARAIFASAIPVVSAIGHETDHTIADLVADVRAATPSVAAELVSPDCETLRVTVDEWRRRVAVAATTAVQIHRQQVDSARQQLMWRSPQAHVAASQQRVRDLAQRACAAVAQQLASRASQLEARRLQLLALSPTTTLARGYALCYDPASGALITSANQVRPGDALEVQLHQGVVHSEVRGTAELAAADGVANPVERGAANGHGSHRV
jgi:exodeoxyribonuclease VII large subunit